MNPKTFRDHISQQCGFNAKQGVWDEKSRTFIKPSGTVQQGRRPMFKPYALQVCNAGKMPDHLPQSFSEWLASNSDSIEMPLDRTEATAQWFDDKEQGEKQSIPF